MQRKHIFILSTVLFLALLIIGVGVYVNQKKPESTTAPIAQTNTNVSKKAPSPYTNASLTTEETSYVRENPVAALEEVMPFYSLAKEAVADKRMKDALDPVLTMERHFQRWRSVAVSKDQEDQLDTYLEAISGLKVALNNNDQNKALEAMNGLSGIENTLLEVRRTELKRILR